MKEEYNFEENIDIKEVFQVLFANKYLIFKLSIGFILLAVVLAIFLPNIYRSTALLAPVQDDVGGMPNLSQYSGLANLAGISLPSEASDKSLEALERIQSFEFFSNYFLKNILLEDLMAAKRWDSETNTLLYNTTDFDPSSKKWIRDVKPPKSIKPSAQEAYEEYEDILSISQDTETGFVFISIEHLSPYIAKEWLDKIIYYIDESMRSEDKQKAIRSIDFLNNRMLDTNYAEIKEALSELLQSQTQILMLTEINDDYIFTSIDSPIVPEEESKPFRLLIIIIGTFLSLFFSSFFVLAKYYLNKNS
tara:strand:- start:15542 stop:16459 length:918 start_codon:yes stop_codon:yes gene_type:complete